VQIKEANKVLSQVRGKDFFIDAQRPYGTMEINL
jgi:hypothetical protein